MISYPPVVVPSSSVVARHGIDDALGLKRSWVSTAARYTLLIGWFLGFMFQSWTAAVDWPVNIGGTDEITMLELARRIVDLTGSASRIRFVERPVDDPGRRKPDTRLARERLGWQPRVDWNEGLARTIDWFTRSAAA
jgi:hypothetical protein